MKSILNEIMERTTIWDFFLIVWFLGVVPLTWWLLYGQ